jgi:cyclopropane fatty-acyl-phospholipid synthase-like methyltransferase
MIDNSFYNKDYFEKGKISKKSCYENYRWIPELTIPMATKIAKYCNFEENHNILDFGCSKGYLVKSLRLLGYKAYGVDISKYAIENIDTEVKKYCKLIKADYAPIKKKFSWVLSKDVLEHLTYGQISKFLTKYRKLCKQMFHVIPLGDKNKYRIKEYHLDKSHVQMNNEDWWIKTFKNNGWETIKFDYAVKGIKDNWHDHHPKGNGFFTIIKK